MAAPGDLQSLRWRRGTSEACTAAVQPRASGALTLGLVFLSHPGIQAESLVSSNFALWSALTSKTFLFGVKNPSNLIEVWVPHHFSSSRRERNMHKGQRGAYSFFLSPYVESGPGRALQSQCAKATVSVKPDHQNKFKSGKYSSLEDSPLMGSSGNSHRHPSCLLPECHRCYSSS